MCTHSLVRRSCTQCGSCAGLTAFCPPGNKDALTLPHTRTLWTLWLRLLGLTAINTLKRPHFSTPPRLHSSYFGHRWPHARDFSAWHNLHSAVVCFIKPVRFAIYERLDTRSRTSLCLHYLHLGELPSTQVRPLVSISAFWRNWIPDPAYSLTASTRRSSQASVIRWGLV